MLLSRLRMLLRQTDRILETHGPTAEITSGTAVPSRSMCCMVSLPCQSRSLFRFHQATVPISVTQNPPPAPAGFRREFIRELKVAEGEREWGLFIDSCFTHCQTQSSDLWHSPTSPRLGNKVRFSLITELVNRTAVTGLVLCLD